MEAVFRKQVNNSRTHDAAAEHGYLLDFGRFDALDPRVPAGGPGIQKDADEIFGYGGNGAFAEQFHVPADVGFHIRSSPFSKASRALKGARSPAELFGVPAFEIPR